MIEAMQTHTTRVLHVAPTPFFADRGCHIRIRGICMALAENDIKNLVCTYPIGRDLSEIKTVRTVRIPGYSKTEAGPSAFKYLADMLLVATVARQIRNFRPDVLHCHLHEGVLVGWVARLLAFRRKLPIVFDMQGSLTGELEAHGYFSSRNPLYRIFRFLEKSIVSLADTYFCSSQSSVDLLSDAFHVDSSRVYLVPDGADVLDAGQQSSDALTDDLQNTDMATAIYTGGLTSSKGIEVLKDAILEAHSRRLPVRFLVIGYPTDELSAFIRRNDLEERCTLKGQVPFQQLSRYLRCANVALEPKKSGSGEASGKVVNYMAAGLPVVCFDTINNKDMLGETGYFAKSETADALVDQLELVLSNESDARARGRAGIERVSQSYSWQAGAKTILGAYELIHERHS